MIRVIYSVPILIGVLVILLVVLAHLLSTGAFERDSETETLKPISNSMAVEESDTELIALVTAYSEFDSCHYPNCVMANGKRAEVGYIACPRKIPLGTKIELLGAIYECGDRTAKWVDGRYDVFMGYGQESYDKAIQFGKQELLIEIL